MKGGQAQTWDSPYESGSDKDSAYRWLVWSNELTAKAMIDGLRKEDRTRAFVGVANEHKDKLPNNCHEYLIRKAQQVLSE